ncbi:MAG: transglycosylase SLT domain-containing protein [Nitrospinota bacterium]
MQLRSRGVLLVCAALLFFSLAGSSLAKNPFPIPKGLEDAVRFWLNVFTRYSRDQAVIHDFRRLSLVYDVVDLKRKGAKDERARRRMAKRARDRYARLLRRWAKRPPRIEELSYRQRRIYRTLRRLKYPFSRAALNVRAQQGLRRKFREGIVRSGRHIDRMRKIFRQYGLPEDLTFLPHVESSFNYRAYSKFGAAGVWQFTRSTGRLFLRINYDIDERRDPILSTHAAAKLLMRNYEALGRWPLAITAYNHGRAGIQRAVRKIGTKHLPTIIRSYNGRAFGFASKNFYAEFLAARVAAKNVRKYFGPLKKQRPFRYQVFHLPHHVSVKSLTAKLSLTSEEVRNNNPALRAPVLRGERYLPKGYPLRVPYGRLKRIKRLYASMPASMKFSRQKRLRWYRVKRGDTIGKIARRFRTSVRALAAANHIVNPSRIRVGKILSIPGSRRILVARMVPARKSEKKRSESSMSSDRVASARSAAAPQNGKAKPKVSQEVSKPASNAAKPIALAPTEPAVKAPPGRPEWRDLEEVRLTGKSGKSGWTRVEPDETLGHFAEWLKTSPRALRRLNRLRRGKPMRLGQKMILTFRRVTPEEFRQRRLEYHKGLEDDFFENYQVTRTFEHVLRKGENLWELANDTFEVPFWLVARYNPDLFQSDLAVGDKVIFPVAVPRKESPPGN